VRAIHLPSGIDTKLLPDDEFATEKSLIFADPAQMTDKPRLIEVAFPLKQASLTSVHEKNVRHGHISTLHIWPARRPLAACRAALLCTLLPDPGDAHKRQELLDMIGGTVVKRVVASEDEEGNAISEEKEVVEGGVLVWGNENAPEMDTLRAAIKDFYGGNAPKVLDPFAGGGAIPLEAMRLGCEVTSSDLNPVAWFIQKCTLDYPQRFAGKKWPLPDFVREWPDFVEDFIAGKIKKRKGDQKPHFTDAKQIQLLALQDADLAWHVRAWGRWVLERARQELAARYPVVDGEPTVAYLWARNARDPQTTGRIPLLKTFWLRRKKGRRAALLPIPLADGSGVTFKVLQEADLNNPGRVIETNEFMQRWEVTAETLDEFLKNGTMNRAGVWSPCGGRPGVITLTMEDLRRQGQQGLLGAQMTVVVVDKKKPTGKGTFRHYRLPASSEIKGATVEIEELEEIFGHLPHGLLKEPMPKGGGGGAARAFSLYRYGIKTWGEIYSPRQLVALGTFARHSREAARILRASDPEFAEAVGGYLACTLNRIADRSSSICQWTVDWDKIRNTFARFALPMCWDFAECVTTTEASGGYPGQLELVAQYVEFALKGNLHAGILKVERRSALDAPGSVPKLDAVVTDPPYYDAIPYSDLMDFYYLWLRRTLTGISAELDDVFSQPLSPKWDREKDDGELIDDESRFDGDREVSKRNYTDGMARAFQRACERLTDTGRLVIVFANKSVVAWETLVEALIRGGAEVTASWPIQTEREARSRGQASAALSSSVWIVSRKRAATAAPGWEEPVLERMKQVLFDRREELGGINILQYYFDLGIRGPDFIWAALGPALQSYSEHPFVKKTSGGMMTVREFLNEVRKLVLQFSLGELPGFRDLQRETQGRGETVALDPVTQYYLLHRAYFGLTPAPAGACILYANACGRDETELKVVWNIIEQGGKSGVGKKGRPRKDTEEGEAEEPEEESSGNEYRLLDWSERVESDDLGASRGGLASPLVDKLHRLMALFQRNQAGEVQSHYESWGLASERAFPPLLQAIRELALQDGNETERRLVEALASQLKLSRQQVMEDGAVKDAPFFAAIDEATRAKVSYRKQKK
jgi:adenine-specific DNA methylase